MEPDLGDQLVAALGASAVEMISNRSIGDLEETLAQVVASAVQTVPGAAAAGITMAQKGRIESRAPYNDTVLRLDRLQAELGQGPCVTALTTPPLGTVVVLRDLLGADAERWPAFAARAGEIGYRSMLSTQLSVEDNGIHAALNLYGAEPDAFGTEARTTAALFGVQAALLLYGAERAANLEAALSNRDVIGQAKGILMERYAVDGEHAFQMLVRSSQDTNLKLSDVARWLVTEGRRQKAGEG